MAGGGRPVATARAAGATNLTQQSENFGYSAVRLRRIVKLQFGIVDPNEMVRLLLLLLWRASFVCGFLKVLFVLIMIILNTAPF